MNGLVRFALGFANVSDAMVADIDKALPGAARLSDAAKQLAPMMQEAQPHIDALLAIWAKASPIVKAAYPDIATVLPAAKEIIAFVGDKK